MGKASHVHFGDRKNGYDKELDLLAILNRHFQIVDVDGEVAKAAGRLRGTHTPGEKLSLKTPDCLIAGTSLAYSHTLFVTNDAQLATALPSSNCLYLRDVALEWLCDRFPKPCFVDSTPVMLEGTGTGLPHVTGAGELGAIKPDPAAKWERILSDAFVTAAAVNEPCLFFLLSTPNGSSMQIQEVLFWHHGLMESRPVKKLVKRLLDHLGYVHKTKTASNPDHRIHVFYFTSLSRERTRQSHAMFASKRSHQKEADALKSYLDPFWLFRSVFEQAQVESLICEDGAAMRLNPARVLNFMASARNVLGWKDDQ